MNALLATLLVTVAAGGGPRQAEGELLSNGQIRVRHRGSLVAKSYDGRIKLRLRPGEYQVEALLAAEEGKPARLCQTSTVRLKRGRTTRLKLGCSIK